MVAPTDGSLERNTFEFQNYARQNPAGIVEKLKVRLAAQTDKTSRMYASIQDAITELSSLSPVSNLIWNKALYKACLDHANDQAKTNQFGHDGSDGSVFTARIARYSDASSYQGENLAAGYSTAEDIIMALIIDDGVSSRGHRKNIYLAAYQYGGIGITKTQPTYGVEAVFDFAGSITNKANVDCTTGTTPKSSAISNFSALLAVILTISLLLI